MKFLFLSAQECRLRLIEKSINACSLLSVFFLLLLLRFYINKQEWVGFIGQPQSLGFVFFFS